VGPRRKKKCGPRGIFSGSASAHELVKNKHRRTPTPASGCSFRRRPGFQECRSRPKARASKFLAGDIPPLADSRACPDRSCSAQSSSFLPRCRATAAGHARVDAENPRPAPRSSAWQSRSTQPRCKVHHQRHRKLLPSKLSAPSAPANLERIPCFAIKRTASQISHRAVQGLSLAQLFLCIGADV